MRSQSKRLRAPALLRVALILSTAGVAACGGASASPTPTVATPATVAPAKTLDPAASLEVTKETAVFKPALRLKIPAGWFSIERDAAAFQVWLDEEKYEITFDSTYQTPETIDVAVARLRGAAGLKPGENAPLIVGGRDGLTFIADNTGAVTFSDSGFHTNGGGRMRVAVVSAPGGRTVSIFVTTADPASFAQLDAIALRILATVEWIGA